MLETIKLTSEFWSRYQEVVSKNVIPYQWQALNDQLPDAEPSHAVKNFEIAAGLAEGEYYGEVFQDSDVAKWIETVAYSLREYPNQELSDQVDRLIDVIGQAQEEDGYLNTYYQLKHPENKWANLRDNHELYCAGHFIEAAVAYYQSTGKRQLLTIMEKFVELIHRTFGSELGKRHGYPGHEEIELALLRMYDVTDNPMHLELAKYFIEERGKTPNYFEGEKEERQGKDLTWNDDHAINFGLGYEYQQAHLPIRQQEQAVGHAVRAVYYYTAVADLAKKIDDQSLTETVKRLWQDIVDYQMYITGGIGSSAIGESFTCHHDLPNDAMYCETCASVGLAFFANKMQQLELSGEYGDIFEKLIYNGTISGMNLTGDRFFYVNPLEINQFQKHRKDQEHVLYERQKWLKTACCPPNLARFIASLDGYLLSEAPGALAIHQYISCEYQLEGFGLKIESDLPWSGSIHLTIETKEMVKKAIRLRIPEWTKENVHIFVNQQRQTPTIEKGYVTLEEKWQNTDVITLEFDMTPRLIYANQQVIENIGKVAIQKGPVIYCVEELDNGADLASLYIEDLADVEIQVLPSLYQGRALTFTGYRMTGNSAKMYHDKGVTFEKNTLTAVPYYAWGNRGYGEMRVWLNKY
ncbi:beta-L-arabinofuranosidase domain-containing protein [uncultured Vagococcus sp.]|uniref:glycoside hydrolase family 127 protein n=1 Tax=uncultured Vagococcus sp. TaxID=189676 RepID=UPI0028D5B2E5|nr:beta-L-arabinofuranosidase domain-containing protein [uncultured Vagococcus sp.]